MSYHAPIEVEVLIHITDGKMNGVATLSLKKGVYPTPESVQQAVADFARDQMPDGFRLMTKREWWDVIVAERIPGARLAVPGGDDWDEPGGEHGR